MKTRPVLALLLAVALGSFAAAADVGVGDTRESILAQYGKPNSIAKRGDREIFLYPKGGRIEFVDGKVADVKGPLPPPIAPAPTAPAEATAPPPQPEAAAPVAPATPAPTQQPAATTKVLAPNATPPSPTPPPPQEYNPAIAANELAKHVEKMDTAWGTPPPIPRRTRSPFDSIPSFLLGLLLRFGITIGALKLAFKFWEMDAFWKGILAIAGLDVAAHALLELLGPVTGGFTTMAAVENGLPGLLLIYTINRFCFNKRIQNAVITAAAVKTAVTLGYIFVGVAALNALFG